MGRLADRLRPAVERRQDLGRGCGRQGRHDPGDALVAIAPDAVEVFAMAASVVTYYAWAIAFGIELRTRSELNMQDIGLFRRSESQVEFTPASCFLSLLRANLPPLVKGLAA